MQRCFHEWVLAEDLASARSGDGREIRFPRQERQLLERFVSAPNLLLSRERLLSALSRYRSCDEDGLRHVDHLVSRLRKRLGDDAREPRFIATEYGEGYRWVAPPSSGEHVDALLVIQPLHRQLPDAVHALMHALCEGLVRRIRRPVGSRAAAVAPLGWKPAAGAATEYLLELSAWSDAGEELHLALMLRDARSGRGLHPLRLARPQARYDRRQARADAEQIADAVLEQLWSHRALQAGTDEAPTDRPLELRLHEATCLFADPASSWQQTLVLLDASGALPATPHVRDLTRAMVLATRIAQQSVMADCLLPQEWDATEAEIEHLVVPHLPAFAGQPLLELAAARVLCFTTGRHRDTAFALARSGFAATTAFATAFSTLARCHAYEGRFDVADDLLQRSIELAEPGSEFHVYLLVLRCIVQLGSGDTRALAVCRDTLFAVKPATRQEVGVWYYGGEAELPPDLAALLLQLDGVVLQRLLYMSERRVRLYFRDPAHQANALRGFVRHVAQHAGSDLLPDSLRALLDAVPG